MQALVRWSVRHVRAMNIAMLAVVLFGLYGFRKLPRDIWPVLELDTVTVSVRYPGASPDEVEDAILERVEESLRTIDGIEEMSSTASEGRGVVRLVLLSDVTDEEVQRILGEVRAQISRIRGWPTLAEKPDIRKNTKRGTAIRVGVIGPTGDSEAAAIQLRQVTERVRSDLLRLPSVSQVDLVSVPAYQIDIEMPEQSLRAHNLSLRDVADSVRRENLDMPAGSIRTESQEILVRAANQRELGYQLADIPLIREKNGAVLTVGDLGTVHDAFDDEYFVSEIHGRPALLVTVEASVREDILRMCDEVRSYVADPRVPDGYELVTIRDKSWMVTDRLTLLAENGWIGFCLVFLMLALFLNLRLAFWVALGVPISLLGACGILFYMGETLNMTSLFAFIVALGIVVDDAIIVGENVYAHRSMGKSLRAAAVDGTREVMPSVITGVLTTVIAFLPILYLEGRIAKFTIVLPLSVGAILTISLIESLTVLPAHLGHGDGALMKLLQRALWPLRPAAWLIAAGNRRLSRFLDGFVEHAYLPCLKWSLRNAGIVLCVSAGLLLLSCGVIRSGIVPFVLIPRSDRDFVTGGVIYPRGTPPAVAADATRLLEDAAWEVNQQSRTESLTSEPDGVISFVHRTVGRVADSGPDSNIRGSHVGGVFAQLVPIEDRELTSSEIVKRWRKAIASIPGAESLSFVGADSGPADAPIAIRLMAPGDATLELEAAVKRIRSALLEYPSVSDVFTDTEPGAPEYRLRIRADAEAMGVSLADLAGTVRASYHGEEVMRLQRGRHEVQLRVRYPPDERHSLSNFDRIRVDAGDGAARPLTELAEVDVKSSYAQINRINQMRSIVITADVDEDSGNAFNIVRHLNAGFMPEMAREFPAVRLRMEGQQEQTTQTVSGLTFGFCLVIATMFLLLTIQFRAYWKGLLILAIIPFGIIGAIFGHMVMGLPLTLFSLFGVVTLAGVVVNDSIVLVDFISRALQRGMSLNDALLDGGRRRFRPVLLTSVTTVAGMLPLLTETSRQARMLLPMATSLCFGLTLTTALVLILVPVMYSAVARTAHR